MCGIFGIYGHDEAANIAYLGLHSLQHRGQESAGIVAAGPSGLRRQAAMGLVSDAFDRMRLGHLPGRAAIGQVRYSTTGNSELRNAQPFLFEYAHGSIAIAHNGNLLDSADQRTALERDGSIFQTSSDTEVIVHLLARSRVETTVERLRSALAQVRGAYSLVVLTERALIAARDPHGVRPLCLGRLKDAYVLSSETSSFDLIEAEFIRELEPGEMVVIDDSGLRSLSVSERAAEAPEPRRFCVFEHVYFARPDSLVDSQSVYRCRESLGRQLAREQPAEADVVIPVPDSGVAAAIGFAREAGLTYEMGLIRSHYVGRTFIEPQDSIRHFGVRLKLSPVRSVVDGKRVVVVDDSLVRGTTSRKIVKMLRAAGAREVHLRIAAPPTTHPCFYGIDTPTRSELIASSHSPAEVARYVTCDSLGYLSHAGMMQALGSDAQGTGYCSACFTGVYPIALNLNRPRESGSPQETSDE
ncbi:amidophosphoribosyltransferase [Haliangium ochraceum]|uniref:amidophosphoribosyltransferase n=1 Tax=Haliangium ochraceum TaxID=80816 RepID=UPI00019B9F7C|nr:amidophosphoribosyltransferase [Haliangium ochraceum]